MARARNIKPAIFKNELLGVADPLITILFESLWCLADREGRLEDRPLRIKAETFPYRENTDVNGYLTWLQRNGFIVRYVVDNFAVIEIVNFKKHQTPHKTEKPSVLPARSAETLISCGSPATTVKAPLNNGENTAPLPPDLLIPDLLIPDSGLSDCPAAPAAPAKPAKATKARKTLIPADFAVSDAVKAWAQREGFFRLDQHLANFVSKAKAKGYEYVDWDQAFMNAIRENWAKVNRSHPRPDDVSGTPMLGRAGQATALNAAKWLEESDA